MPYENKMEIVDYSDRSIAVIGDSRAIKDQLKELGGRYNRNLTVNDETVAGWIFSKKKEDAVRQLVEGGEPSSPVRTKSPPKRIRSSKPPTSKELANYQDVTVRVLRPYKGQILSLYTYPDDDIGNIPEAIEAKVLYVGPSGTQMSISYEGNPNAKCVIIDGQWGLYLAAFPNYIDL